MTRASVGIAMLLFAGCGGTAPPTRALTSASEAIGAANQAGATTARSAEQYLATARRELDDARARIDEGDNRGAYRLLVRAKADADLATALARREHLQNEAAELGQRAEALRNQTRF